MRGLGNGFSFDGAGKHSPSFSSVFHAGVLRPWSTSVWPTRYSRGEVKHPSVFLYVCILARNTLARWKERTKERISSSLRGWGNGGAAKPSRYMYSGYPLASERESESISRFVSSCSHTRLLPSFASELLARTSTSHRDTPLQRTRPATQQT